MINPHPNLTLSSQLLREVLASVETLSAVIDEFGNEFGSRALIDLIYLQQAVAEGHYIDVYPEESSILEIIARLPSASTWIGKYIKVDGDTHATDHLPGLRNDLGTVKITYTTQGSEPGDHFVCFAHLGDDSTPKGEYLVLFYADNEDDLMAGKCTLGDWRYSAGPDDSFDDAGEVPQAVLDMANTIGPIIAAEIRSTAVHGDLAKHRF